MRLADLARGELHDAQPRLVVLVDDEDAVGVGVRVLDDRARRHEHRLHRPALIDRRDREHARLEQRLGVRHARLDPERARFGRDRRVDGA